MAYYKNYKKPYNRYKKHYTYSDMMMIKFTISLVGLGLIFVIVDFIRSNPVAFYSLLLLTQLYLIYNVLNKRGYKSVTPKTHTKSVNYNKTYKKAYTPPKKANNVIAFNPKDIVMPDIKQPKVFQKVNQLTDEEREVLADFFIQKSK